MYACTCVRGTWSILIFFLSHICQSCFFFHLFIHHYESLRDITCYDYAICGFNSLNIVVLVKISKISYTEPETSLQNIYYVLLLFKESKSDKWDKLHFVRSAKSVRKFVCRNTSKFRRNCSEIFKMFTLINLWLYLTCYTYTFNLLFYHISVRNLLD